MILDGRTDIRAAVDVHFWKVKFSLSDARYYFGHVLHKKDE